MLTREQALAILHEFTKSESLRKHALAVESCVTAYARKFGEDETKWSITALLHDFDYEMHPMRPITRRKVSRFSPSAVSPTM
jgi:predicted hydrolase (HD superfamily)